MPELTLRTESDHNALADTLFLRLSAHREAEAGPMASEMISLSIKGAGDEVVAGLSGEMFWNACVIRSLWVDEPYRRRGLGRQLIAEAERRARERPCDLIYVSTFEFQAPDFYASLGFEPFGQLPVPHGSRLTWFSKSLRNGENER